MLVPNLEYAKLEMCTNILKLLSSVNLWDAGVSRAWQGYWQEQLKSHLSAYSLDSANLSYDLECVHRHVFLGLVLPGRSHHSVFLGTLVSGTDLHGTCLYSQKTTVLCWSSCTEKHGLR